MRKTLVLLSIAITVGLLITACNLPFNVKLDNSSQIATSVAQTVAAVDAMNQQLQPTSTMPVLPTQAPLATNTPLPASTAVLPPTATPLPCNQAIMISETIVDGTSYNINTTFNKSWRIKNVGTCTWNTNYKIAFMSGDSMSGPSSQKFNASVAPGGTIDLILPLKSPGTAGSYTGYWGLYDDSNIYFGKLWVTIKSVSTAFAVTSVVTSVDSASSACPHTFNFSANITSSAVGTVTYYWRYSNNGGTTYTNASVQSITFGAAGTKTITYSPSFPAAGSYIVNVYIDNPNHQNFGGITVTCS